MPMDIHKQAIEKILASKILKQQEAPWDFVYTPSRIYTCFLLHVDVYLDFADKKSQIAFQVQLLLTTSAIYMMQNVGRTFLRFQCKVPPKQCQWMQMSTATV